MSLAALREVWEGLTHPKPWNPRYIIHRGGWAGQRESSKDWFIRAPMPTWGHPLRLGSQGRVERVKVWPFRVTEIW